MDDAGEDVQAPASSAGCAPGPPWRRCGPSVAVAVASRAALAAAGPATSSFWEDCRGRRQRVSAGAARRAGCGGESHSTTAFTALPAARAADTIRQHFGKYGDISEVVRPRPDRQARAQTLRGDRRCALRGVAADRHARPHHQQAPRVWVHHVQGAGLGGRGVQGRACTGRQDGERGRPRAIAAPRPASRPDRRAALPTDRCQAQPAAWRAQQPEEQEDLRGRPGAGNDGRCGACAIPARASGQRSHAPTDEQATTVSAAADAFKQHFERFGKVVEAQIMVDHTSGRSRGFG